ncbi:MAG TPA: HdeA/HdeB family chaperone [Accumulibacter sp.]|uniref:HdeA/HdeB family chaperone n=1 Tax=Accumulibacter sp. TaxID=2053492 RepID=UPI002B5C8C35|nr:HdeA/HdeB family chaperone [Accumulibacter sp.]HRD88988.1 HdeA/HdeB family chaperone [Accumulibacter sp.]
MPKMTRTILPATAVVASLILASNVYAEAPKDKVTKETSVSHIVDGKVKLNSFLCKDVMRLSGDDRDISISFMHGYILGKKNATDFVVNALGEASDKFMEYCLDHPTDMALQSMEKFLK